VKRSLLALLLTLGFLFPAAAQAPKAAAAVATTAAAKQAKTPYKVPYVTKTLANGLEVIVYPDTGVPLVTVEMAVRNGSFTEPPELNGLSHLYEHMFFKTNKAIGLFRCDIAKQRGAVDYMLNNNCGELAKLKPELGDTSYLNQLENNQRPLTVQVLLALNTAFGLDLQTFSEDDEARLISDLREALSDAAFGETIAAVELRELAMNMPAVGRALVTIHRKYRQSIEQAGLLAARLGEDRQSDVPVLPSTPFE